MLFTANKYTHWYYDIVNRAQTRVLDADTYIETHHIIPRSLGGDNNKSNLAILTGREHFICHWLLTKITTGQAQKKMAYACKMMMHSHGKGQQRYQITSKIYESLKQKLNVILKDREFTESWRNNLKTSAQNRTKTEGQEAKQIKRDTMIKVNKSRKGEKRLATTGSKNHFYGKGFFGKDNPFYGQHHTEKTLEKLRKPKSKIKCDHCGLLIGGQSNYNRWHGNNCKMFKLAKEEQNA